MSRELPPQGQGIRAKRFNLFATPLAVCVLPERDALKAALSDLVHGGPRGANLDDDGFAGGENAAPPLGTVIEAAVTLATAMDSDKLGAWDVAWRGEILQPGRACEVHSLPASLWCAHYLIDAGGSGGALELQDPRGAAPVMYAPGLTFAAEGAETLGVSQSIGLTEGALAVFPAWMLQSTRLHEGDRARLSLTLRLRRNRGNQ